jgi:hypothetical protein
MASWVVLVEAVASPDTEVDRAGIERLLLCFEDARPGALYAPDRYVLQVLVDVALPDDAVRMVLGRWRRTVLAVGLAGCRLVRAEVMTLAELLEEGRSRTDLWVEHAQSAEPALGPRTDVLPPLRIRGADVDVSSTGVNA